MNNPGAASIQVSFAEGVDPSPVDSDRIRKLVTKVLSTENKAWAAVGVIFTNHVQLRDLNRDFLGHDYETDVLSFLIDESDEGLEGEVYVDLETAAERYAEFGSSLRHEAERYVIHGLLHLAGYNDATQAEKDLMHRRETEYLDTLS